MGDIIKKETLSYKLNEIKFKPVVLEKIKSYVMATEEEIGGLLEIEQTDNGILVTNAHLFEYEASAGHIEITEEALTKFITEKPKQSSKIHGWWHSHGNLDVFWSGVDDATFTNLLNIFGDYCFGIVANRKGNMLMRGDVKTPLGIVEFKAIDFNYFDLFPSNKRYEREAIKKKVEIEKPEPETKNYLQEKLDYISKFRKFKQKRNKKYDDIWDNYDYEKELWGEYRGGYY